MNRILHSVLPLTVLGLACVTSSAPQPKTPAVEQTTPRAARSRTPLDLFFDQVFAVRLARSPERQSRLGLRDDYGSWDDLSPASARAEHDLIRRDLESLRAQFAKAELDDSERLSYRLFEYESEDELDAFAWRLHDYPVNQMFGAHSSVVSFLCNVHRVASVADARAYLSRLEQLGPRLAQLRENLSERQALGVLPPKFVFPMVLDDCRNILAGAPFSSAPEAPDSVLLADFRTKVEALELIDPTERDELLTSASRILVDVVQPAYEELIDLLESQYAVATENDGVWKLPNGAEYYAWLLHHYTSTELGADAIHALGLAEVERIHGEMQSIMQTVGFEDGLQEFFDFMRTDDRFYYPNTDAGREAYLARATALIEAMKGRLDELFLTQPKSELIVKAVEPYRAASAGKAFYDRGAPDGSRPGIYYANLYDMRDMPTYQMEALAYHEGIPGHHMQLSIAMELEDVPTFRRYGGYTAYGEGWGLYTEKLPKELGCYADPYDDFGRLAMELWRACRLVVDTGIHSKRWTREQAIDYLRENTPNPEGDCVNAIERYIVMPGQATAYTVGMLEILRLREEARAELGAAFDLREFHDVVLRNGAVPLPVLAELVEAWVSRKSEQPGTSAAKR